MPLRSIFYFDINTFYWCSSTRDIDGTYTSKIFVQQLYVSVDDLQSDQFIILVLYGTAEIKAGVSKEEKKCYKHLKPSY